MSATKRDVILAIFRDRGRADALDLRGRAAQMDGTAIIAEEAKIPEWSGSRDYSSWPIGAPVRFSGNVFGLLQPHNASHYPDTNPSNAPALWSIKHTIDPHRAKPFFPPFGTSGLYMDGECCLIDGVVYRSLVDSNPYSPTEYADFWEIIN